MSLKKIFTQIYNSTRWHALETQSGHGSTLENTQNIREWLPKLIIDYKISSILDIGCGDFNWMRKIDINIPYIGIDVVTSLIRKNNEHYGSPLKKFMIMDATANPLPAADLIIVRAVLYHLSFTNITKVISNIFSTHCRYILITNVNKDYINIDINDGAFRRLNLFDEPMCFHEPLATFHDCDNDDEEMCLFQPNSFDAFLKPLVLK